MRHVGSSTLVFAGFARGAPQWPFQWEGTRSGGQWSVDGFRDPALAPAPLPPSSFVHLPKRDIGDAYQAITR